MNLADRDTRTERAAKNHLAPAEKSRSIRVGVVGLGKMGLSHLSIIRANSDVTVTAIVDPAQYLVNILSKYAALTSYTNYDEMLGSGNVDAIIIATPNRLHFDMAKKAIDRGIHVFCEKPLSLSSAESYELAQSAERKGLVNQVGYHNRFIGTFKEVRRLLELGAIGEVTHARVEAYGPVVLEEKGSNWRSRKSEGGGCLYDYAAHPLDLLTWYLGKPDAVGGVSLGKIFSTETHDDVYGTLFYPNNVTGQLSVNWSDESCRKMTTQVTLWGKSGRIYADRQEIQVYLRPSANALGGYNPGWNVRYGTELAEPVQFYLRGEEYTAQLEHFVKRIQDPSLPSTNDFASAAATDRILELLTIDAESGLRTRDARSSDERLSSDPKKQEKKVVRLMNRFRAAGVAFRKDTSA